MRKEVWKHGGILHSEIRTVTAKMWTWKLCIREVRENSEVQNHRNLKRNGFQDGNRPAPNATEKGKKSISAKGPLPWRLEGFCRVLGEWYRAEIK